MRSASDYGAHVRGLLVALVREGLLRRQTLPVELRSHPDGRSGNLFTSEPGLLYTDGAVLRIVAHAAGGATAYENAGGSVGDRPQQVIFRAEEAFTLDSQGEVQRERYAYHYERATGYYFRFEREQHREDLVYKPEYHLHVLWRLPHFPAAPLRLEDMLDFIRVNFYGPHRPRLVGQSLAVTI